MITLQVLSLAIFVIGIWLSLRMWQSKRRNRWPSAKGQIIDSGLSVETVRGPNGNPITFYSAAVRYRFQVGHKFYESTRISLTDNPKSTDSTQHRTLLARYPIGRIVQVHFDARQPRDALLECATKSPSRLRWLFSISFLILGTVGVIAAAMHL